MKDGFGTFKYVNLSEIYEGEFKMDKKNGKGSYLYKDGTKYVGHFVNELKEGDAEVSYCDGSCFKGQFKNSKKNGKGKFVYSNGDSYEGEFVDNLRQGLGEYWTKSGKKIVCEWTQDFPAKGKKVVNPNSSDN